MKATLQYRLRANVDVYETESGCVLVSTLDGKLLPLGTGMAAMINRLETDWTIEDDAAGNTEDLSTLYYAFILMRRAGMLDSRVIRDGRTILSLSPSPEDSAFTPKIEADKTYYLNRYAFMRRREGHLLLESPLTPCRITLHDPKLTELVHQLCSGLRYDGSGGDSGFFLSLLLALSMAEPEAMRDARDPMDFWQFHDLLFYSRTLKGRHVYPLGGTYRFQDRRPSLDPIRNPISDDIVTLPEISDTLAERLHQPFCETLGNRSSKREFSEGFLTMEEIGGFLHAAARVKEVINDPGHDEKITLRPSPGGGARHPLEIYPLVRRCRGIEPGVYRYDAMKHHLEKAVVDQAGLDEMLAENPHEYICRATPQVTLYISARIGRTAWKYASIAYKVVNQDMGCLFQTFYLVATALGLSPCAIGSVDTKRLGQVLQIDWREEPFIGAFTLGKNEQ